MRTMKVGWAALAVILVATAAWTFPPHPVPKAPIDTLMEGWQSRFSIDYAVEPRANQTNRISGYVINHSGSDIDHLRVLAQEFDASGQVIGKQMRWVVGGIGPDDRGYFEINDVPTAASYRVTVWDYDTIENS